LKEKSLNFKQVSEELKQLLLMLAEDIQDMSQDILQLRDLLSLRPTSTICLKGLEMLQDLLQSTDKESIWSDRETKKKVVCGNFLPMKKNSDHTKVK
jgi:hypothetical protein